VLGRLSVSIISILCFGTSDISVSGIVKPPEEERYKEISMSWNSDATYIGRDSRKLHIWPEKFRHNEKTRNHISLITLNNILKCFTSKIYALLTSVSGISK
jgi:hypothetical protein